MPSEYDPIGGTRDDPLAEDSLEQTRNLFARASRPYLAQPWSWLAWGLILPFAALSTTPVFEAFGSAGVLLSWSIAVIVGGAFEAAQILRASRSGERRSTLAGWVLRCQGNLSLVGLFLSIILVVQGFSWLLPGVWLLLLGHSLFSLGGLAATALRTGGLVYQLGGVLAIWPHGRELVLFAAATCLGNLWIAGSIWRARSASR